MKISAITGVLCLSIFFMVFLFRHSKDSSHLVKEQASVDPSIPRKVFAEEEGASPEQELAGSLESPAKPTAVIAAIPVRRESAPEILPGLYTPSPRRSAKPRPYPASGLPETPVMDDREWNDLNDVFGKVQQLDSELKELDKRLDNETTDFSNTSKKGIQ